ncbi:MAG: Flp family type IVb pilin, partial [Methylococcaceae bacterium]|nr:Flp family type IVb pilin [Methylococcaceae bacterium]
IRKIRKIRKINKTKAHFEIMQARIMQNPLIAPSNKIPTFLNKQKGATMVEYAIMVALIAIVAITAVKLFGTNLSGTYNSIVGSYPG